MSTPEQCQRQSILLPRLARQSYQRQKVIVAKYWKTNQLMQYILQHPIIGIHHLQLWAVRLENMFMLKNHYLIIRRKVKWPLPPHENMTASFRWVHNVVQHPYSLKVSNNCTRVLLVVFIWRKPGTRINANQPFCNQGLYL